MSHEATGSDMRLSSCQRKNDRCKRKSEARRFKHLQAGLACVSLALTISACSVVSNVQNDYPLPVYPGAAMSPESYSELLGTRSLILKTRDSSVSVYHYYLDKLKNCGWQITNDKKINETYLIDAVKGKENANITIEENVVILTWIRHHANCPRKTDEDPRSAALDAPAI